MPVSTVQVCAVMNAIKAAKKKRRATAFMSYSGFM